MSSYEHRGVSASFSVSGAVAAAWETALREMPNPWDCDLLNEFFGHPRTTYRERLDRQPRNAFGELIPRIATVRRHLRQLGKPRQSPRLPA